LAILKGEKIVSDKSKPIESSWDKPLPQAKTEKLLVDDLNGIQTALTKFGYLSREEYAATQKFIDDLKPLSVTERIAAAHRANVLELHQALKEDHDPYLYFPSWKDGNLVPQYAAGQNPLTPRTRPLYGHMLEDNKVALDKDLAQEKVEAEEAARKEEARKKLMGK
jgi:hypothetical protein